jgi:MFS family permease
MIQGLSSMSEMIGAQIYVTEITKPPVQYPAVTFIGIAAGVGGSFALFIAFLVTSIGLNWRAAFWLGSAIAAIGTVARTKLRETPEFVDMKRRKKKEIEEAEIDDATRALKLSQIKKLIKREEINKQTLAACFSVYCGWPVTFYLAFMYFNPILKGVYGYSSENIIFHNFLLSLILVVYGLFTAALSYKTPPLKIMKIRAGLFLILALLLPTLITYTYRWSHIFFLQVTLLILNLGDLPGEAILIKHFPIFKRFTATSFLYALTRAIMYVVTSFGLVFLTGVGLYGLWIILLPITLGFLWGIRHFEKLEGLRPSKPSKVTNDRVRSHAA